MPQQLVMQCMLLLLLLHQPPPYLHMHQAAV